MLPQNVICNFGQLTVARRQVGYAKFDMQTNELLDHVEVDGDPPVTM